MKLKRDANSFQKVNSDAPTNTIKAASGNKTRPNTLTATRGERIGSNTINTASGASTKVAAPRSKHAPMSSMGTVRHGTSTVASALKAASPIRTSELNATKAISTPSSARNCPGNTRPPSLAIALNIVESPQSTPHHRMRSTCNVPLQSGCGAALPIVAEACTATSSNSTSIDNRNHGQVEA